jgi:hypothetical protein
MAISMYQASIPVFQKFLGNLDYVLEKGANDAANRKIDPTIFLQGRLAPDMLNLIKQVQIACDHAKGAAARLSGTENPKFEDNEASFADLRARIGKTQAYLASFSPAQIDGSEERAVVFKAVPRELNFRGIDYLLTFATPNFYFHYTTAYAILRHLGVGVGKSDYVVGRPA